MDEAGVPVELYIYDLTKGMARMMSPMFLGRQIEGVWHTSIVAYGREYFFGSGGVTSCSPGATVLGEPEKRENLGESFIPYQVFVDYIVGLGESTYSPETYNLFEHNCNNFSNEIANFLCGKDIPKYILDLPSEVLNTPFGQTLRPLIDSIGTGAQMNLTPNENNRSLQ